MLRHVNECFGKIRGKSLKINVPCVDNTGLVDAHWGRPKLITDFAATTQTPLRRPTQQTLIFQMSFGTTVFSRIICYDRNVPKLSMQYETKLALHVRSQVPFPLACRTIYNWTTNRTQTPIQQISKWNFEPFLFHTLLNTAIHRCFVWIHWYIQK